jgi:hypothetical protein
MLGGFIADRFFWKIEIVFYCGLMMAADNFLAFTSASIFVQYSFYTLNVVRD